MDNEHFDGEVSQMPTRGQLERSLSQCIQALYRKQLGHQPSKVTCRFVDCKLMIIVEDAVTPAERVLAEQAELLLVQRVRNVLDKAFESQLKPLIHDVAGVEGIDMLGDSTVETGRLGVISVLNKVPKMRRA